jgi:hypothetical protein
MSDGYERWMLDRWDREAEVRDREPVETCRCGRILSTFNCPWCGDGYNARRARAAQEDK